MFRVPKRGDYFVDTMRILQKFEGSWEQKSFPAISKLVPVISDRPPSSRGPGKKNHFPQFRNWFREEIILSIQ